MRAFTTAACWTTSNITTNLAMRKLVIRGVGVEKLAHWREF